MKNEPTLRVNSKLVIGLYISNQRISKKNATTKMNTKSTILGLEPEIFKMLLTFLIITFLWYHYSPFFDNPINVRIGALCKDGFNSNATGSGACSFHGGVSEWQHKKVPHETGMTKKLFISIFLGFTLTFPILGLLSGVKEKNFQ